jgi:hypothetical protein
MLRYTCNYLLLEFYQVRRKTLIKSVIFLSTSNSIHHQRKWRIVKDHIALYLFSNETFEMLNINNSLSLGPLIWNETNPYSIPLFHHPVLYGVAIYALFLIIIGTIGKFISNV